MHALGIAPVSGVPNEHFPPKTLKFLNLAELGFKGRFAMVNHPEKTSCP